MAEAGVFAVLALLSAAIVRAMIAVGVMDRPGARSSHLRPTPKGGGVGIVVATLTGLLVLGAGPPLLRLAVAGLGLAIVSWCDDVWHWPFSVKLAAQAVAAVVAASGGTLATTLSLPVLGTVAVGWLAWPLTLCWSLVVMNAVNFMDGLNGLAAGSVGLACLAMAAFAAVQGASPVVAACLSLAAGIAGFLPFNYPSARIFMGDVGSQFCGLMVADCGLLAARDGTLPAVIMPALLAGLLFDVAFTLLRRMRAGDALTEAHRSHLYQVANRAGMPAAVVSIVEWGFVAWGAVVCTMLSTVSAGWQLPTLLLVLPPQVAWLTYVVRRARGARLTPW